MRILFLDAILQIDECHVKTCNNIPFVVIFQISQTEEPKALCFECLVAIGEKIKEL